jgi:beta-glucanase (GH16 family)
MITQAPMARTLLSLICSLATTAVASSAFAAVTSAELYTGASYQYGRFEARVRFAPGDGVVSSFFLWKDGSERPETYWNELDFEKLGATCFLETNAFYGKPQVPNPLRHPEQMDLCTEFHTYTYEWTPEYIVWLVDGVEIRRATDAAVTAFAENATAGMQIRFNIWPGDITFGGNFSPSILPVYQQIDWVEYSSYADGDFTLEWRDDFDSEQLDARWLTGSWASPKNNSTHNSRNVTLADGKAVLALTQEQGGSGGTSAQGGSSSGGNSAGGPSTPNCDSDDGCSTAPGRPSGTSALLAALGLAGICLARGRRLRRVRDRS